LRPVLRRTGALLAAVAGLVAAGLGTGVLTPTLAIVVVGMLTLVLPVFAYVRLRRHPALGPGDRARLSAFRWVFLGSALFWMMVGQDGSVLTLFARDSTDREVLGFSVPASWLQSATPLFILVLAPVFAWGLTRLRGRAGVAGKFSVGLLLAGTSFLLMAAAAALAAGGDRVSPLWLLVVYLMHACGELIVAAVGISAAADVLPTAFMGHTLGLLWLFAALGGGLGSQVVRLTEVLPDTTYFLSLGLVTTAAGVLYAARREAITAGLSAGGPAEESVPTGGSSAWQPAR
jgi:POT family proton-dependent oligopeptide transporter